MEFDANEPQATGGNREQQSGQNEHGDTPTPLDTIRGNGFGSATGNAFDSDGGEIAESESGGTTDAGSDTDSDSSESTALETAAEETLRRLFDPKGKHPFLTDKIIEEFAYNLRTCIFQELAAIEAGISVNSMKEWMRQGRIVHDYLWDAICTYDIGTEYGKAKLVEITEKLSEADWVVFKFYQEAQKAKAYGERDDLDFISRARSKDWKAAKYRLTIRNRQVYSENLPAQTNVNVSTGDNNFNLTVVDYETAMTDTDGEALEVEATDVDEIEENDERTTD